MSDTPTFLDTGRPPVPDLVVPGGITPFYLPQRGVRGRLVRLGELADALLTRHDQHPAVTALVGQALALAASLSSALKYRGSFSLQAKGDGPVRMLLADCTEAGALRGYAAVDPEKLARLLRKDTDPLAAALLGVGYLAFTVDQGPDTERYQGIVAITGLSLPDMAMHYFKSSEQHGCAVRLDCALTENGWRAAALILEQVPDEGGTPDPDRDPFEPIENEAWRTATTLAGTVTEAEMLDDELPPEELIWRLFGTEGVALDLPRALAYGCRCSRAKLGGLLETFPPDDLDHMSVEGEILMNCEFCNYGFKFARDSVRGAVADL